jgi:STE24 endopeptidase
MSEQMATRMGGRIVYSVPVRLRLHATAPGAQIAGALAATEAAVRLLRPRERPRLEGADAGAYFSAAELDRARRFRSGQRRLGWARGALELAALAVVVRRPPAAPARWPRAEVAAGAASAAALAAGATLLGLPLRAVSRERARRVGLVTQSWGGWLGDLAKGLAIELPVASGGGALLVGGLRRLGPGWWLPGAAAVTAFGTGVATLAPVLLDPLFNRFEPLPDGPLRRDVLALAERAGVRVGEVYEVDASRRTTAINAYVTGLGPTKRVVLYDTLLRDFTEEDVRFVVAHELGHVRYRDVFRGVALMAVTAPTGLLAVARLADRLSGGARGPAAVPAVALAAALVAPPVGALSSRLSRAIEARADVFAMELTGESRALVDFERRIALANVIDPAPPAVERLVATHPTTMERIGLALAAEGRR